MEVVVNWGERNTKATYTVKAKDVAEVDERLRALAKQGRFTWEVARRGIDKDTYGFAIKVTLEPSYRITMPSWPGYRDQSQEVKDNWDAMWKGMREHEEEHRRIFERYFRSMVRDLEGLKGPTANEVRAAFKKGVQTIREKHYAFDKRTEHGRTTIPALRIPQAK